MLDIQVKPKDDTSITTTIKIGDDVLNEVTKEAAKKVSQSKKIDGFRKGKAPLHIIKSKFPQKIREEIVNISIGKFMKDVAQKVDKPIYEINKIENLQEEKSTLAFDITFDLSPFVEIGKTKDIIIKEYIPVVKPQDIDEEIEKLRKDMATFEDTDDKEIKEGVCVVCDIEVWINDAPSGNPVLNQKVILGKGHFDKELEKALLEKKPAIGDEISINKKAEKKEHESDPSHYDLVATIKNIQRVTYPELNDEFATKFDPKLKSLDELKAKLNKDIAKAIKNINLDNEFNVAIETLLKNSTFQFPQSYLTNSKLDFLEEKNMEEKNLKPDDTAMLETNILERSKNSVLMQHIFSKANDDQEDKAYRSNFKLFLKETVDEKSVDPLLSLYDQMVNSKESQPALAQLMDRYLNEFNFSLIEKYFRNLGVFKKSKKLTFEEVKALYDTKK